MDSQKSHHDINHEVFYEPKVHSISAQHQIALAATKNIPGATDFVNNHFIRKPLNMPFSLKPIEVVDKQMHHIVGEVYT